MSQSPGPDRSLERLLVTLMNAHETQLAHIARLLHDDVGQVLSAVGLQLDVLRTDLKDRAPEIVGRTAEIQRLLEQAVTQVRQLSYDLYPAVVERAGLHFALDRLVGRFRETFNGSLRLLSDPSVRIPSPTAGYLYKIAEHALENAVRHAQATRIEILLRPARNAARLEVRDNGAGFDVQAARRRPGSLGLLLMERYAAQGGLEFSIHSSRKGTVVKTSYSVL